MSWCFAIINGRLAEFYWDIPYKGKKVKAHCYVKRAQYKTKHEQKMIDTDIAKYRFSYRGKKYRRMKVA